MGRKQTMVGDGRWRVHRLEQYKNEGFNDAHEPKRLKRMIYGNHGPPHSLLFSPEIQKFGITCMAFCLVARVACKGFFLGRVFFIRFSYTILVFDLTFSVYFTLSFFFFFFAFWFALCCCVCLC